MVADTLKNRTYPSTVFKEKWDPDHKLLPETRFTNGWFSMPWYGHPKGVNADYPYEFCCQRIYTFVDEGNSDEKDWEYWNVENIALWAHFAKNASFYTLSLENPNDTVFYASKPEKSINCDGCTTSYIHLVKGTTKLEELSIDLLSVNSVALITDGVPEETSKEITLSLQQWVIKISVEKTDAGIKLYLTDATVTPIMSASNKFTNNILRIPITVKNDDEGVAKTVIWTISAIWDKDAEGYIHRYKLSASPNNYTVHLTIRKTSTGTTLSDARANTNTGVKLYVYQDLEDNAWHAIENYSYIVQIETLAGSEIYTSGETSSPYLKILNDTLWNIFLNNTTYTLKNSSGWSDSTSLILKLYVNDPAYNSDTAEKLTAYPNFCLADLTTFNLSYFITEILQGEQGNQGNQGNDGDTPTGANVSASSNGTTLALTIDGTTYNVVLAN